MKIIENDIKKGFVVIKTTDPSDLWILRRLIKKGDIVEAKTYRVIKDAERGKEKEKIQILVSIEVEKLKLEHDTLRISGKIISSDKDIGKGKYQSITIRVGDNLKIVKKEWNQYDISLLKEGEKVKGKVLLVAFDLDECSFAIFTNYSYKIIDTFESKIKKDEKVDFKEYFGQIASKIIKLDEGFKFELIVIGSPLDWKEKVKEIVLTKKKEIKKKIRTITVSYGGPNGIIEMTKRKELLNILNEFYIFKIKSKIEEVKEKLVKDLVVLGLEKITEYLEYGAIQDVIITEDELEKIEEIFDENIFRNVNLYVVPKNFEEYFFLKKIGGAAGILKYKIY